MACPRCGSNRRRPIALGYWECLNVLMVPQPMPTLHGMVMHPQPLSCVVRYHEGSTAVAEMCECWTFAIGRCCDCEASVCGDHSALWGGFRRCGRCIQRRKDAQAADEKAKKEAWEAKQAAAELARQRGEDEATLRKQECKRLLRDLEARGHPGCRVLYDAVGRTVPEARLGRPKYLGFPEIICYILGPYRTDGTLAQPDRTTVITASGRTAIANIDDENEHIVNWIEGDPKVTNAFLRRLLEGETRTS